MRCFQRCWLLLCFCWLLLPAMLRAQSSEQVLSVKGNDFVIADSKIDGDGNIISVGSLRESNNGQFRGEMLLKTDRNGTLIWAKKAVPGQEFKGAKLLIASNGDYVVFSHHQAIHFTRVSPSGAAIASMYHGFTNTINDNIYGIAELPNKGFVICGFNDFIFTSSNWVQYKGYLIFLDSMGQYAGFKTYGHDLAPSSPPYRYYFNDVACSGTKIIVAGGFFGPGTSYGMRGLLMTTDLDGENPLVRITPATVQAGGNSYGFDFMRLQVVGGRAYVSSALGQSTSNPNDEFPYYSTSYTAGYIDLSTFVYKGLAIRDTGQQVVIPHRIFVRDTGTWYFARQLTLPGPGIVTKDAQIAKVQQGNLARVWNHHTDSASMLSSLFLRGDTLLLSGTYRQAGLTDAYTGTHILSLPSSQLCHVQDTSLTVFPFAVALEAPPVPPQYGNFLGNHSHFSMPPFLEACDYLKQRLCGTGPCQPAGLSAQPLDPLRRCGSQPVRIAASSCYPAIRWYHNGQYLAGAGDTLVVDSAGQGSYFAVSGSGLCADTTQVFVVQNVTPVVPVASLSGDTLFSTPAPGYQWLDSLGNNVPGATDSFFLPTQSGSYAVRTTDSNGCSAVSARVSYTALPPTGLAGSPPGKAALRLYPNPAGKTFTIRQLTGGTVAIRILAQDGRDCGGMEQAAALQDYEVAALGLRPGVYFLQARWKEGTAWLKLVVR